MIHWGFIIVAVIVGLLGGCFLALYLSSRRTSKNKNNAAKILENAYAEAKTAKKEAILEAESIEK